MLGPLSQAESKKRMNQAITINECMNVMRKRAVKACFLTILVNSPLTLEKQNEIQAYKNVDTLSSKNKTQFEKPDDRLHKTSGKGEKLKTFEKVLTLLKND